VTLNLKGSGEGERVRSNDEGRLRRRAESSDAGSSDRAGQPGSPDQVQQTLDDALADSFPASDPVSIVTSQHEEAWDEHAPAKETTRTPQE